MSDEWSDECSSVDATGTGSMAAVRPDAARPSGEPVVMLRLGHVVMTARLAAWIDGEPTRIAWLIECLDRHSRCDWGDLDHADGRSNDQAVAATDGRVLSNYELPGPLIDTPADDTSVWIITDDLNDTDRTTTVLWPIDY